MAGITGKELNSIALNMSIYHDVETIMQVSGAKHKKVFNFLKENKYSNLSVPAISQRYKLGRFMLKDIDIRELHYIDPYSLDDAEMIKQDIKKAAS